MVMRQLKSEDVYYQHNSHRHEVHRHKLVYIAVVESNYGFSAAQLPAFLVYNE